MNEWGTCNVCGEPIPGPKSGGHCNVCHKSFYSDSASDKHRVGAYGVDRRCLTTDEMLDKGMSLNRYGTWIGESRKKGQ